MLNKDNERALAHVEAIVDIQPIEGADRIEVATVLGWKVVVKKGEFKVGDKIVYVEVDSRLPEREEFEFMRERHFKVKTIKLRKQISQGIVFPMNILKKDFAIGTDVTKEIGITKIQDDFDKPELPNAKLQRLKTTKKKLMKNPIVKRLMRYSWFRDLMLKLFLPKKKKNGWVSYITKTDEERIQNMPFILTNKENFIVTEKLDGTSTSFGISSVCGKRKFVVCSRNVVMDTPTQKNYYEDLGNVYWEMALKYDIENVLNQMLTNQGAKTIVLQGETIGEGIQGNKYGLTNRDFFAFNLTIDGEKIDSATASNIVEIYGIQWCPILDMSFKLLPTVGEMLDYATGKSMLADTLREGCVFRNYTNSVSFKAVSNEFLLQHKL